MSPPVAHQRRLRDAQLARNVVLDGSVVAPGLARGIRFRVTPRELLGGDVGASTWSAAIRRDAEPVKECDDLAPRPRLEPPEINLQAVERVPP